MPLPSASCVPPRPAQTWPGLLQWEAVFGKAEGLRRRYVVGGAVVTV
jgi:hypothetical protein